jgi:hypothetical protein
MRRSAALALCLASSGASAHGLGQRYDLPIPLWLYLAGAGTAVAASFVLLVLFRRGSRPVRRRHLGGAVPKAIARTLQGAGLAVFVLVVLAGLFGSQNPLKNIAPVAVWVLWWVGFAFVCAFLGDLWPLLSPFATLFRMSDAAWRSLTKEPLGVRLRYPRWLGAWPAVALFWVFAWAELVAPERDRPRNIAIAALGYAALTWLGAFVFGSRTWVRRGEAFAIAFAFMGRFAPLQVVGSGRRWAWRLRPYALGLLSLRPLTPSMSFFVLLMLATLTVDGLLETPAWLSAAEVIARAGLPSSTLLLLVGPLVFACSYAAVVVAMSHLAGRSVADLAGRFVLSLVPIAIAYHLAHYLSFLLLAGQLAIPLASDPFGLGWDLFGTTLYRMDIGIVDARFVWLTAVTAIVVGHIAATWIAHETADLVYPDRATALRSQYPMIALMIAYTVTSLWILAQPIVEP